MNSYITKSLRSAPQVVRRSFEIRTVDNRKVTVHGTKGANGEWSLEAYMQGEGWVVIGYAYKDGRQWWVEAQQCSVVRPTLDAAMKFAYSVYPSNTGE